MKVVTTERIPIKLWLPDEEELPDDTMQQLRNLANLPVSRFWVGAMPDCHLGYGMPIGGVLCAKDAVVPNAVGVDIGCGMIAMRLNGLYRHSMTRETLQAWRVATHKRVPVGMASHKEPRPFPDELHDALLSTFPDSISEGLTDLVQRQLGTLGGGNHFIELQYEESSTSPLSDAGSVWLMLHSGSRGLGKAICDHYHARAKANMLRWFSNVPDLDLAFIPKGEGDFVRYMTEMEFAMKFAEANRREMLHQTLLAVRDTTGWTGTGDLIETHHNFARLENHYRENVVVHRKGAVHAKGLVTIPGSMGTASYIAEGLENEEAFATCSHGAGRMLGRKQANRVITREEAEASMSEVVFGIRDGDFDEMPKAYKDIDAVMRAQEDLARPVYRLRPLAVVKG